MDIHKPKPFHNWREFLKEYGIIVLGVLTALGLEQAVHAFHERQRVHEAIEALDAEIREGLASAQIVTDMQDCQRQQLEALSDAVGKGDQTRVRTLLAQGDIYRVVPFNNTAWTSALASDVSNHIDKRRQLAYSGVYYVTGNLKGWTSDYARSAARLASFVQIGLSRSPAAAGGAVTELAEMTSILSSMQRAARVYLNFAEQGLGMKADQSDIDAILRKDDSVARCNAAAAALGPVPKD
jgi:hypothetical protein